MSRRTHDFTTYVYINQLIYHICIYILAKPRNNDVSGTLIVYRPSFWLLYTIVY